MDPNIKPEGKDMSFLDSSEYDAGKAVEKDVIGGGGFKVLSTDVYLFDIIHAYFSVSAGGAKAVNLELKDPTGGKHRFTVYITNKEGSIKYKDKQTGELSYLPGFLTIDSLCLLTVGKPLMTVQGLTEKKTINLYNYEQKKEVPTDVDMLMPLLGQQIKAAVVEKIENKTAKNASTGKYEPTNEKRTSNEIVKIFRVRDNKTTSEVIGKVEEAKFMDEWLKERKGKPLDRFKEVKAAGNAGAPGANFGAGTTEPEGTAAGQDNLFL